MAAVMSGGPLPGFPLGQTFPVVSSAQMGQSMKTIQGFADAQTQGSFPEVLLGQTGPAGVLSASARPRAQSPNPQGQVQVLMPGTTVTGRRAQSPGPPMMMAGQPNMMLGVTQAAPASLAAQQLGFGNGPGNDERLRPRIVEEYVGPKTVETSEVWEKIARPLQVVEAPPTLVQETTRVQITPPQVPSPMQPQPMQFSNGMIFQQGQRVTATTSGMPLGASLRSMSPQGQRVTATTPGIPLGSSLRSVSPMPAARVVTMNGPMHSLQQSTATLSTSSFQPYQVPPLSIPTMQAASVPVPVSVLTHIDTVVSEMERELSDIQAAELREVHNVRDNHLAQLRRILAEDLLRGREQESEAEASRLSVLEADHLTVKQQVLELEGQRSRVELERDNLLQVRGALEGEHESRLNELQGLAATIESMSQQVLEAESKAELEKEAHMAAETDLGSLQAELREVLENCKALQVKVQDQDAEMVQLHNTVSERDSALAAIHHEQAKEFASKGDFELAVKAEVLAEKEQKEAHMEKVKAIETTVADYESRMADYEEQLQKHEGSHSNKNARIRQLEQSSEEMGQSEQRHLDTHQSQKKRIAELELLLQNADGSIEEQEARHSRLHSTNRQKISDMEQELADAIADKDGHYRSVVSHKSQLKDLERQSDDLRIGEEKHTRQSTTHRMRIQELDQLVADLQGNEADHVRKHGANRSRIQEFEQLVEELTSERDNHARSMKDHQRRTIALTQELETAGLSGDEKARMEKAHRAAILLIEEQLSEATTARDRHAQESRTHRQKHAEGEDELQLFRSGEENHLRAKRKLEKEFSDALSEHNHTHREHQSRIKELEEMLRNIDDVVPQMGSIDSINERVTNLVQMLNRERGEIQSSRREVDTAREAAAKVQRDAEMAIAAQEALTQSAVAQEEVKLAQVLMEKRDIENKYNALQMTLADASTARTSFSFSPQAVRSSLRSSQVQSSSRTSTIARQSLAGEVGRLWRSTASELMSGNMDPFVIKVREACSGVVQGALEEASQAHRRCIVAQVQRILDVNGEHSDLRSLIREYDAKREIDSERRLAAENLDAAIHDLRACGEELPIQHHLTAEVSREVAERLELEIERCEAELALLVADSSLDGIPHNVLKQLCEFHSTGPSAIWDNGHSPMHWAAHQGRHDIIEYLLSLEGGAELLQRHDHSGRNVMYYAQLGKRRYLQTWLNQEVGITSSVYRLEQPVAFNQILGDTYKRVLEQIHAHGWRSMSWKEGYTMLHWAANKGHLDLCKHLVELDADPIARDSQGRTPIDIAVSVGNQDLRVLLEDLRQQRRQSRRPSGNI